MNSRILAGRALAMQAASLFLVLFAKQGFSIAVLLTLLCADEATVLEHAPLLPAPLVAGVDRVV